MNILQILSNKRAWCKLFKHKVAYLEGLEKDTITLQIEKVAEYKRLLDYAQDNFNREQAKLTKYIEDRDALRIWVPENQDRFDNEEIVLSDKVTKLAQRVAKSAKDLPDGLGQDTAVL